MQRDQKGREGGRERERKREGKRRNACSKRSVTQSLLYNCNIMSHSTLNYHHIAGKVGPMLRSCVHVFAS